MTNGSSLDVFQGLDKSLGLYDLPRFPSLVLQLILRPDDEAEHTSTHLGTPSAMLLLTSFSFILVILIRGSHPLVSRLPEILESAGFDSQIRSMSAIYSTHIPTTLAMVPIHVDVHTLFTIQTCSNMSSGRMWVPMDTK